MRRYLAMTVLLAFAGLASGVSLYEASAQPAARDRIQQRLYPLPNKSYWGNKSAQRRMGSARGYANDLFEYSWRARRANPQYAQTEAAEVERNVQAARKNLQDVRQEHPDNKEIATSLDSIDKQLATALSHHEAFCDECAKGDANDHTMMACCNEMVASLDKAIAEHQALMRKLMGEGKDVESPQPPQKGRPR